MYKYFTKRFGIDPTESVSKLRLEFPRCSFSAGKYKGDSGIYVLYDRETKIYGESYVLENGDVFWNPSEENVETIKANLSSYKKPKNITIPVELHSGVTVDIFPASAIPRQVFLGRANVIDDSTSVYNKNNPYGVQAFELFEASRNSEEILVDDPRILKLIRLGLMNSYTLPIEVFDALSMISLGDLDNLFAACLGFNDEFLKKE